MALPYEDIERILAIDDLRMLPGSSTLVKAEPHQGLRISYNKDNVLVLHHTAYSPNYLNKLDDNKFELFKEKLSAFDLKSSQSQKETVMAFSDVMSDINPDWRMGFKQDVGHTALTADITIHPNRPLSAEYRITTGVMFNHLTPDEADHYAIHHKKENFTALKKAMTERSSVKKKMGFKEISSEITCFLHKDMFEFMLMNGVGGIYSTTRRDNSKKQHSKEEVIYGSTLNYAKDYAVYGDKIDKAVIRGTANRKSEQSIDLAAMAFYLATGENKFSNEFLETVAQYKMLTRNFNILTAPTYETGLKI